MIKLYYIEIIEYDNSIEAYFVDFFTLFRDTLCQNKTKHIISYIHPILILLHLQ